MSTTTQHKVNRPKIKAQPNRVCVGYISDIPAFTETDVKVDETTGEEKPQYYFSNVSIKGTRGSQDIKFGLLLRPEWFTSDFNIEDQIKSAGEASARSLEFVYQNNVANPNENKLSTLDALAGSRENFENLYSELVQATEDNNGPLNADQLRSIITHFVDEAGGEIGYVVGQRMEADAEGKKTIPTQFSEVKYFFFFDEDGELPKFLQKQVDAGKVRVTFER